jgi:MFS family permease
MIGESCDSLMQGKVMSYMSLAWGLGCIAGPTIGGLLAQPCNTWPGMVGCSAGGLLLLR